MVRGDTPPRTCGCIAFNSPAVTVGETITSLLSIASVLFDVFLGRPEPFFLSGMVLGGSPTAAFLSIRMVCILRPVRMHMSRLLIPSLANVKTRTFSSLFNFDRPITMKLDCFVREVRRVLIQTQISGMKEHTTLPVLSEKHALSRTSWRRLRTVLYLAAACMTQQRFPARYARTANKIVARTYKWTIFSRSNDFFCVYCT